MSNTAQSATAAAQAPKAPRLRSPSYPGINLEAAIKRAQEFYDREKRNSANAEVAVQHWGFKPTSGGGYVVLAALKAFGLIADTGTGRARKIQLTDLALRILLDRRPDSMERRAAIQQAALMPKIHASLWDKFRNDVSDENLQHELVFERKFNENSVSEFIKEYRDTIRFAKLDESDSLSLSVEDKTEGSEMEFTQASETRPVAQTKQTPLQKEISLPVGLSEEGQAIFAHLRFDAPLKKEMLASLKNLLEALEKTLN